MTKAVCPPGQWTDLGNTGATIIETRGLGGFVCLTADKPVVPADALSMASNEKMTFSGAVSFYPAGNSPVNVYHSGA
jgi:hypothetical protein